jgi:RND family efflux transporter MFP subunit
VTQSRLQRIHTLGCLILAALAATGCQKKAAAPAGGPQMQALPVQTITVTMAPVAQSSEYVATIKSRRSATMQPQVSGSLTVVHVRSGDHVRSGQALIEIDPRQQQAAVASQRATERQKKALSDYDTIEVDRQSKLFEAGVTSRDAYDQAQQAYQNAKADYESAMESRRTQEQLLAYYTVRAPFDGVVGDIPVHVGDYVTTSTVLTTVDENKDLEAYIYIPTERAPEVRMGLGVDLTDNSGKLLEKTKVDFISAEVDSTLQGILVKAPVVPVLAVARQGEESFVFVVLKQNGMAVAHRTSVTLGDTVGNSYSISSGLNAGDSVIVSGMQFLVDGMPVMPLPPGPPQAAPAQGKGGGAQSSNSGTKVNAGRAHAVRANQPVVRKHRHARARTSRHTRTATVS